MREPLPVAPERKKCISCKIVHNPSFSRFCEIAHLLSLHCIQADSLEWGVSGFSLLSVSASVSVLNGFSIKV